MLRFSKAPAVPPAFNGHVTEARTKIESIVKAPAIPMSKDFEDRWGRFKAELLEAQHNKCGYCEMFLGTHPGDVEHYEPKAELQELPDDESKWGKEGEGLFNVEGRSPSHFSDSGYWWSAYSWKNYLAACNRCNSGWKRNLFPIDENPRSRPRQDKQEKPLLLNPFRGEDPAAHLEFTKLGQVTALNGSLFGRATIATCGLDRPSLVQARNEKVTRAYELVDEYAEAETKEKRTKVIKSFIKLGDEKYIFAGMVRAIFKQKLQLPWQEWEQLLAADTD